MRARSCGVETITAPAGLCFWTIESWMSPVPGGRSTTSHSVSPQSASINWPSAPLTIGPRQASALPGSTRCAIDSIGMPITPLTGDSFLSRATGFWSSLPISRACDGP